MRLELRALIILLTGILAGTNPIQAQNPYVSWQEYRSMEEASIFKGIKWTSIGPAFMSGRIESLDIHPDNPAILYAGMGSGGLWRTENQGLSWTNIFSNEASFSVGDLAISQSDPETLWLGTGEQLRASRGYTYSGTGVYQSTDGGRTWINKGLTESYQIGRVVVDPMDPSKVFVAVIGHFWSKEGQRGLYYTEDAGESWQNLLNPGDSIGISDVAWDSNNQTLYACAWQLPEGDGSVVYQSEDLGKTWKKLPIPFTNPEKNARPGIAISQGWPNIAYVVVDNRTPLVDQGGELAGLEVYRSDDYGISWKKTHHDPLPNYSGFGWAFGDVVIHPSNPNEIFVGGVHLLHSTDAGQTFEMVKGKVNHLIPNRASTLHLDQHDFSIIAGRSETWFLGNDGGVYLSRDRGSSWLHLNTIPTGEFYDIQVSGSNQITITGGTQDNSNIVGRLNPWDFDGPHTDWEYIWLDPWSGGDGFTAIQDPDDADWFYWESQNGHLNKKNIKTGENRFIKPVPDQDEAPLRNSWFTPYLISPFNHSTLYYAANKVYKSIDKGETWTRASHDLTFSDHPQKKSRSITRIAVSGIKPGIIYAGTEKGALWVTRNDGIVWHEISAGLPDKKIVDIVCSAHMLSRVYIVMKAMDERDPTPYVYVSENFGSSWKPISSGLPAISANCLVEDPKLENLLGLGTDAGLLVSQDRGLSWQAMSYELPTCNVVELRWMAEDQFLLAATHGQGLFYCHFEPIRKFAQSGYPEKSQFLGSISGKLPEQKDYARDFNEEDTQPLVISWYSHQKGEAEIRLMNGKTIIHSFWAPVDIGINQHFWNLIISREEDKTIYPLPEVNYPKAGKYTIEIFFNPETIRGEVEILSAGSR